MCAYGFEEGKDYIMLSEKAETNQTKMSVRVSEGNRLNSLIFEQ